MKKIIFSLMLVSGSFYGFGQTTETKGLIIDGEVDAIFEVKSDLPSNLIPDELIIESNGSLKSIDGFQIGYAVRMTNVSSAAHDPVIHSARAVAFHRMLH